MKKLLVCLNAFGVIIWFASPLIPQAFAAYSPSTGDIIKVKGVGSAHGEVYWIDSNLQRDLFVNRATYNSWYPNFNTLKTISQSDFESLVSGPNVTAKAEALIKFDNADTLYKVMPNAGISAISTQIAESLYGKGWLSKIVNIQSSFENDYIKNTSANAVKSQDETLISPYNDIVRSPYIYGNQIVYDGLYLTNAVSGDTKQLLPPNMTGRTIYGFNGNQVVYKDGNSLKHFDIVLNREVNDVSSVGTDRNASIGASVSGNKIIYSNPRSGGGFDVLIYDMNSLNTTPLTNSKADRENPKLNGNYAIWFDNSKGLVIFDVNSKTEMKTLTNVVTNGYDIYGNNVLYYTLTNAFIYNIATGATKNIGPYNISGTGASINDKYAVWTSQGDIYAYNLSTGQSFKINTISKNCQYPQIYGNQVIWIGKEVPTFNSGKLYFKVI